MLQSKLGNGSSSSIGSAVSTTDGVHHMAHMQQQPHTYGGIQGVSPAGNFSGPPYSHHPQNVNLNLNLNPMLGEMGAGGAGQAASGGGGAVGPIMGSDPNLRHFDGLRAENPNYC